MNLTQLLSGIACGDSPRDIPIHKATDDSRAVEAGDLFVCIRGGRQDGHDHAARALEQGAAAVVTERDLGLGGRQILVGSTREAWARICANAHGNPADALTLVGVTGTNGKTTITYLLRDILRAAGKRVGLIGSIQNEIGDMVLPARHTTPSPMQLHELLARMRDAGMEYVVMEVSSHALDQHRVDGLRYACAVFTNLTRDHLDYHETMENYYQAKRKLFHQCDRAVLNIDDEAGQRLAGEVDCPVYTISAQNSSADFSAHSVSFSTEGSDFFTVHESHIGRVHTCLPGVYSVSNALCAMACAYSLGLPFDSIVSGLKECRGVLGRTEVIDAGMPFIVLRDYAHDPDGLLKILTTVRGFHRGRIVTLFGCAGERDRAKRPEMGRIVAAHSDQVILTSDNPRGEDPLQIIRDTTPGFEGLATPVQIIADRYDAIRWALEQGKEGDILLLLGKGHEDYQVLSTGTIYFDERFIVRDLVSKLRARDTR